MAENNKQEVIFCEVKVEDETLIFEPVVKIDNINLSEEKEDA